MARYFPPDRPRTDKPLLHTAPERLYKQIHPRALRMRKAPTPQEKILWQALRRNALGVHFRRQHEIDPFIVDFLCIEKDLVVEVDGPIHEQQQEYDAEREAHLRRCGYRIVRFTNDQVEKRLDWVVQEIRKALR